MVNFQKNRQTFYYLFFFIIGLFSLIGIPSFGYLIFTPGNHTFALYNTQLRAATVSRVTVRNRNIVGSTYFNDSTSSYIGFIANPSMRSPSILSFNYFAWSNITGWNNLKNLQKVLLFTGDPARLLMVKGLTRVSINGTNVFTTLQIETTEVQSSYHLISFFLNGTQKSNHLITGVTDRYFNLEGITSLNNGSYCLIAGKYFENRSSSITHRVILTVNSTGSIQREILLDEEIYSLVFIAKDSYTKSLWTGKRGYNFFFTASSLSERDESGAIISLYPIKYPPTEMDFLTPEVILIRRARPTILTFDVYDTIPVVTYFSLILFLTLLVMKMRQRSSSRYLVNENSDK